MGRSKEELLQRDRLIDRALRGEITDVEAEAEAARLGIGLLATTPDVSLFRPEDELWWSLPMAVAWIAWRSLDRVREFWDDYRNQHWIWVPKIWRLVEGPTYHGFELKLQGPVTPLVLSLSDHEEAQDGRIVPKPWSEAARHELWRRLGAGALSATAIDLASGEGRRVLIPSHEWADLDWCTQKAIDPIRLARARAFSRTGYGNVRLRSDEILAVWPQAVQTADSRSERKSNDDERRSADLPAADRVPPGPGHGWKLPPDAKWEDLVLEFTADEVLVVRFQGETRRLEPIDLGMRNRKSLRPTLAWHALRFTAELGGMLYASPSGKGEVVSQKYQLVKKLQATFGIAGDPMPWSRKQHCYVPRFGIHDGRPKRGEQTEG